ncbi:MAG: c-type cytochrome [Bacteroidetes bacterium]|jgi:mono/diheme cytochrome c family protein|nr:c-type cytochrome [Bacteroidota bacterium]
MPDSQEKQTSFPIQLVAIPAAVIVLIFSVIYLHTESDRQRTYPLTEYDIDIPDDSLSVEHGRRIFTIRGCVDCHGDNAGGKIVESGVLTGTIVAPNLTTGTGSALEGYSGEDIVRVIREGVKPNGQSVVLMPSHKFRVIHKRDIESLVAYLRYLPPVNRDLPATRLNFPIRFYYFLNRELGLFPANLIQRPVEFPQIDSTDVYEKGRYLASSCVGCHGHHLEGGPVPGAPPYWPEAPDLTASGPMGDWTKDQFKSAMKNGVTPDGRHLDEQYMPWPAFGQLTDEEFDLIWNYLHTL